MAIMISIYALDTDDERIADVTLPANKNTIIDAMDKAKIFGETFSHIMECKDFPELENIEFIEPPTLDELNFLAKRLEEISADKEDITPIIAYRALLRKPMDTIGEAINRTYDLYTVPVYPCKDLAEYGEIVLDNEFLEELKDLPDEVYDLLDPEKVGRAMAEREGGVFIDGYYAIADSYEPALVYDEELPEQPENWVFRLEVAGVPERAEDFQKMKTEILTLPADEQYMQDIAEALGERHIVECVSMKFESAIPQINNDTWNMEEIYLLNDIARDYTELSREDAAKFKAALESEQPQRLDRIEHIMKYLDNFEFDHTMDRKAYAEEFHARILPPNLDKNVFSVSCTDELGEMILAECSCKYTDYGIISEYGGSLFPTDKAPQQEQGESQSPEMSL